MLRSRKARFLLLTLLVVVSAAVRWAGQHRAGPSPHSAPRPPVSAGVDARTAPAPPPAVTPAAGRGFRDREHLAEHYQKHGREFGNISIEEYLRLAQDLRDRPAGGDVLELVRDDGVVTRFDRSDGAFLAANPDGTIRTFFRPNDGEAYFRRQAERGPGGR